MVGPVITAGGAFGGCLVVFAFIGLFGAFKDKAWILYIYGLVTQGAFPCVQYPFV